MNTTKMIQLLELIANSVNPETMSGPHLTEKGRAELAFAALDNFRSKAKKLLEEEPFDIGAYLDGPS